MGKGLGNQQKAILKIINEMPDGGGKISDVYAKLKVVLYPELYSEKENIEIIFKDGTHKTLFQYGIRTNYTLHKEMNRARVSLCTSIKGLLKRGYLKETRCPEKFYGNGKFHITEEGKKEIKL